MKILKKGKLPDDELWVGKCGYCGCEVEILRDECRDITSDQKDGTMGKFTCPTNGCRKDAWAYPRGEQHP